MPPARPHARAAWAPPFHSLPESPLFLSQQPRLGQAATPTIPAAAGAAGPPSASTPPTTGWPSAQAPQGTFVGQVDVVELQLAARAAGLPLDWMNRVSHVQQPAVIHATQAAFMAKLCHMNSGLSGNVRNLSMAYMLNPSGQAWLLLAFPDGTEDDALRMFEVAGDAGVFRIALAGPEYDGVAVLARGLLGPRHVFETVYWEEPCANVDPRKWSIGCFKSSDQLLPVFLVRISAALHSDLQREVIRLKQVGATLEHVLQG